MKLIIAGGRDYILQPDDYLYLDQLHRDLGVTEVVHGGARGADTCGGFWGRKNNIPVKVFPAEWDKFGKSAGYRRNREMAQYVGPDGALCAFPGGRGTANMTKEAEAAGLKVFRRKL